MTTANDKLTAHVRETLENATKSFNKLAVEQTKLNEKRTGSYTSTMDAAIEAKTAEVFSAVWDGLKSDIAGNVGGIGKRLGCKVGKANSDGNAPYVVPASMMVAVSTVLGALKLGISLTDKDGKARSFGEVRQAKAEAEKSQRDADAAAKMTPAEKAQAEVAALARAIAEGVKALTEKEARETIAILSNIVKTIDGSANHKPDAAKAGKADGKADKKAA